MAVLPLDQFLQFGILLKSVFNTGVMDEVLGALPCVHKVLCIVVVGILTLVVLCNAVRGILYIKHNNTNTNHTVLHKRYITAADYIDHEMFMPKNLHSF